MKKNTILIAILILLCHSVFAITYTFTGIGNWNDATRWTPSVPLTIVDNDLILINGKCTIPTGQFIEYGNDTSLISFDFIINDTLIINGGVATTGILGSNSNGVIFNNGNISAMANNSNSGFNNSGYLLNHGNIYSSGELGSFFSNSGLIDNYGSIWADASWVNNGIINSYSGGFGSGPMGSTLNNGTINGTATFQRLINSSSSILSLGYGFGDTDTMTVSMDFRSVGTINFDINSTLDKDLIKLSAVSLFDSIGNINVYINPSFTPTILDTFVLFQSITSASFYSLQDAKFNITLPPPPSNYFWKVIKEQDRIYITLDFSLPEPIIFFKFYATKQNNTAHLKYKLFEKDNNLDHFVVERTLINDIDFIPIGEFKYDENNKDYNFIDANPLEGENIYHIMAYNKDGKINHLFVTNMYQLGFYETKGIVLNTMVENDLQVSLESSKEIKIINPSGKIVFKQTFEKGQSSISLSHLSKGIYFVQTNNATYKILKL